MCKSQWVSQQHCTRGEVGDWLGSTPTSPFIPKISLFSSSSCLFLAQHMGPSHTYLNPDSLLNTNIRAYMWIDKGSRSVPHIHRWETTEHVFISCEYMVSPTLSSVRATQLSGSLYTLGFALAGNEELHRIHHSRHRVKYILTNVQLQVFPRRAHFESSKYLLETWRWADKNQEEERACLYHRFPGLHRRTSQPLSGECACARKGARVCPCVCGPVATRTQHSFATWRWTAARHDSSPPPPHPD